MREISPHADIASDAVLDVADLQIGDGAVIGPRVELRGTRASIGARSQIGRDCTFAVRDLDIGADTTVDRDCHFSAIGRPGDTVEIGDDVMIGPSTNVVIPLLRIGDFVKVHNHVLINGYTACFIGHNTWIGQYGLLNAADDLVIGNNVSLGIGTCIFTHAFAGELLAGCQIHTTAPTTIEDNVWTAGPNHMIGPGVTIGARSMILPNAVVNQNVDPGSCYGGVPARDLTDQIKPFRDLSIDERLDLMRRFVGEYAEEVRSEEHVELDDGVEIRPSDGSEPFFVRVRDAVAAGDFTDDELGIVYTTEAQALAFPRVTVFDVADKLYTKLRTDPERELIRFMNGFRARFAPRDLPRVAPESAGAA
jgi:acetyltransferase-like isoleucine patch superfamily enzyme